MNCKRSHRRNEQWAVVEGSVYCLGVILLAMLFEACAAQAPPPGGPEDKTPPKIDTTTPFERQLNVPVDTRIQFQFDRDVDKTSFQQAFSITPYLDGTPIFHWSGDRRVSVELPQHLHDSTTYTAQLSRDLKSRRGNSLANPARVTFSTGSLIDTGTLSGFLLTPISGPAVRASEIYIFAYDITVRNPDTLNLTRTPPDLLTQPNDQGQWQLLSMKVGHRYRVFAISDAYRNHVYDPGIDAFGVPSGDAVLDSSAKTGMYIRMSPIADTIPPDLQDAEVVDSFHIRAHFSEAIDSNSVRADNFSVAGVPIVAAYRESPDRKPAQITLLTSVSLAPNTSIMLEVRRDSVRDLAGNPVRDSAHQATFTTPLALRGATAPRFLGIGIRDSARDISTMPAILVTFSDAVDRDSLAHALTLTDTGGKLVPVRLQWLDDARLYVRTIDTLASNLFYAIRLRTGGVRSPASLVRHEEKDTVFRFRFRTTNARDFGKLSGDITIADSFLTQNLKGALVLQLFQPPGVVTRQLILPHGEKHFFMDQVPTGTFRMRSYFTKSGTASYEAGSVWPWRFGMPTGDFTKEITTRPRWEVTKVDFEVK